MENRHATRLVGINYTYVHISDEIFTHLGMIACIAWYRTSRNRWVKVKGGVRKKKNGWQRECSGWHAPSAVTLIYKRLTGSV